MKKITIDPSVAVELDIDSVAYNERVELKFTSDSDWTGIFDYAVYNSVAKNTVNKPLAALTIAGKVMTLVIEPATQAIEAGSHYYELLSVSTKRVIFKGNLIITK